MQAQATVISYDSGNSWNCVVLTTNAIRISFADCEEGELLRKSCLFSSWAPFRKARTVRTCGFPSLAFWRPRPLPPLPRVQTSGTNPDATDWYKASIILSTYTLFYYKKKHFLLLDHFEDRGSLPAWFFWGCRSRNPLPEPWGYTVRTGRRAIISRPNCSDNFPNFLL